MMQVSGIWASQLPFVAWRDGEPEAGRILFAWQKVPGRFWAELADNWRERRAANDY